MRGHTVVFLVALLSSCFAFRVNVEPGNVTVSGISSGAEIASQYQVAFSASTAGAAIFAGGPYYCAQGSILRAAGICVNEPLLISIADLESLAQKFASTGLIDPLSNLRKHSMYIYSGLLDTVVLQPVVRLLEQMMRDLGVSNIQTEYSLASEHCWPTDNWGDYCAALLPPFINNCAYDAAGRALVQFYGPLNTPGTANPNSFFQLDQGDYTPNGIDPDSISMAQYANVYVPSACQNSTSPCKLHVAFHGCLQSYSIVGSLFTNHAGLNEWAETNKIIVVYPQAKASLYSPYNPMGCWDWWGYTNSNYAFKNGQQLSTIKNIVDHFISGQISLIGLRKIVAP